MMSTQQYSAQHKSDFRIEVDQATRARAFDAFLDNIKKLGQPCRQNYVAVRSDCQGKQSDERVSNSKNASGPSNAAPTKVETRSYERTEEERVLDIASNNRRSLRRSERKERSIVDSPRSKHQLQPISINKDAQSSLRSSTGPCAKAARKSTKPSREEANLQKETMMEYLENTIFEHQAELAAFQDRFDRMEEENRRIRSELARLRRENKQLVRVNEKLEGVHSELDVLKRHLGLIPPLPKPYRRSQDPRGAPFAVWRRDPTRAKFRPPPIRTDTAQDYLQVDIQLKGERKHKHKVKANCRHTSEVKATETVGTAQTLDEGYSDKRRPEQQLVQGLKRGRDDTKMSPSSPHPPVKRRRSKSGSRSDTSTVASDAERSNMRPVRSRHRKSSPSEPGEKLTPHSLVYPFEFSVACS